MRTLRNYILSFMLIVAARAEESVQSALQRGLVAEEAQRNLNQAKEAYREAVRLGEAQTEALATALYRLGEVQLRLGETNAAVENFARLLREFPQQTRLVGLARKALPNADAGSAVTAFQKSIMQAQLQEVLARARALALERASLEREVQSLSELSPKELSRQLAVDHPTPLLSTLLADASLVRQQLAKIEPDFGPQHPERVRLEQVREVVDKQLAEVSAAILASLTRRLTATSEDADRTTKEYNVLVEKLSQAAALESPNEGDASALLRQEIALAEEQLAIIEKRKAAGQASQEDLIRAQRDILGLKRQLAAAQPRKDIGVMPLEPEPTDPNASSAPESDAEETKELARLRKLAAESPDLLRRSRDGARPLPRAASQGWTRVVTYLLDLGVPPEDADSADRSTALHLAARAGNLALVRLLLDRGAKVDSLGNMNETPLHSAVRSGHRAVATELLERGANINAVTGWFGGMRFSGWENEVVLNTPLHLAVGYGAPTLVDLLLEHHAKVDPVNSEGYTPLLLAFSLSNLESAPALVTAGANPNLLANQDSRARAGSERVRSPMHAAARLGNEALLESLLKAGGSARLADTGGITPLHEAIGSGSVGTVQKLLAAGVDVNARAATGETPLDWVQDPKSDLGQVLVAAGAVRGSRTTGRRIVGPAGIPQQVDNSAPKVGQVVVYGEVSGRIAITNGVPRQLAEALQTLHPLPSANLAGLTLRRVVVDTEDSGRGGSVPVVFALPLTPGSTNAEFEVKSGDLIFVPPVGPSK